MDHAPPAKSPPAKPARPRSGRKAVRLTLDAEVVARARAAGLKPAEIAEEALRSAVGRELMRRWEDDNAEAIRASNDELRTKGLWSASYRLF